MDHSHPTLSKQTLCSAFLISVDNMPSSQGLRSSTLEPSLILLLDPHPVSLIALPSQHVQSLSLLRSSADSAPVWAPYMGIVCVFPVPLGFQAVLLVKNPLASTAHVRDMGSTPGSGRSPGGEHGNPLQYSCLENPKDKGVWCAIGLHRVAHNTSEAIHAWAC